MPSFSVIIPVYNRPDEIGEVLESLSRLEYTDFEVIVVDDGSTLPCADVVRSFSGRLTLSYIRQNNAGPGAARNTGAAKAASPWYIFFDSDCLIPNGYFGPVNLRLAQGSVDAWGGPDRAHASFTPVQKAINYAMTSFLTTGGIRGSKRKLDRFYPRSFNMGVSRKAFEACGGFSGMRFGEDLDLSMRLSARGFVSVLIPGAFVYHKRRTRFSQFFKQVFNSGIARIHLYKRHPHSLKVVHFLPSGFLIYLVLALPGVWFATWLAVPLAAYILLLALHALYLTASPATALLSVIASFVQLTAYGGGFLGAFVKRVVFDQTEYTAFLRNFYK